MSAASSPPPKRRRAAQKKRVVSVPAADVDGSPAKGDGAPPSDSWAWRKYGQKPIKGSPYPRAYYRCSSAKGCPARKQVERSHVDPTMLVITYACDHNHPWPISRSNNAISRTTKTQAQNLQPGIKPAVFSCPVHIEPDGRFADMETDAGSLMPDDLSWLSGVASSPANEALLESPILAGSSAGGAELEAMLLPMREEDESLFADLGELPECSLVFRRGISESRPCSLRATPWCGSTG